MKAGKIGGFLLLLTLFTAGEEYYRCFGYSIKDLSTLPENPKRKIHYDALYLALPPSIDENHPPYLFFTRNHGSEIVLLQALLCRKKDANGVRECGGECDAGSIAIDSSYNLIHKATDEAIQLAVWSPGALEEEERVTLLPVGNRMTTRSYPTPCPPVTATLHHPRRDGKEGRVTHRYVCYEGKTPDGRYEGCAMSPDPCTAKGKKHFGRYPTEWATKKALVRCLTSRPKVPE